MAITKIHPIKASVQKAIDYICDPNKTDGELLVDSFACSPVTAEYNFLAALSGTARQDVNLAYHLIQAFSPDEVNAEEAHQIGEELAAKILDGNFSYVIATHVNTHSVHNHIIFCAADNFEHKKYNDCWRSYCNIRNTSDTLCREHGLSVIEEPSNKKGLSYNEWLSDSQGKSWKSKLKSDIRDCIASCDSYDAFVGKMRSIGYDVAGERLSAGDGDKCPKYIRFRAPGYERFVRGSEKTLGKEYTKESIAAAIENRVKIRRMEATIPTRSLFDYKPHSDILKRTKPNSYLIDTTTDKMQQSPGLKKWAEKKNLQSVAHAYAETGSLKELEEKIETTQAEASSFYSKAVECDRKIRKLKGLATEYKSYRQYAGVAKKYNVAKNKERFYEEHESQLMIYEAARNALRKEGLNPKTLKYEQFTEAIDKLQKKKNDYQTRSGELYGKVTELENRRSMIREYTGLNAPARTRVGPSRGRER